MRHQGSGQFLRLPPSTTTSTAGSGSAKLDGVDGLEMNVSCPNIKAGGIEFGTRSAGACAIWSEHCRKVIAKPLWVKLTPNYIRHRRAGAGCAENGADAVSVINTITGDGHRRAHAAGPALATIFGGLSGPAIKPIALRMVYQIHRARPRHPHLRHRRHPDRRSTPSSSCSPGATHRAGGHAELHRSRLRRAHRSRGRGILPPELDPRPA